MLDYIESKIARREHDDRARSLAQVEDYDKWLTRAAGSWLAHQAGDLLSSLGKSVMSLGDRLSSRQDAVLDTLITDQEQTAARG